MIFESEMYDMREWNAWYSRVKCVWYSRVMKCVWYSRVMKCMIFESDETYDIRVKCMIFESEMHVESEMYVESEMFFSNTLAGGYAADRVKHWREARHRPSETLAAGYAIDRVKHWRQATPRTEWNTGESYAIDRVKHWRRRHRPTRRSNTSTTYCPLLPWLCAIEDTVKPHLQGL